MGGNYIFFSIFLVVVVTHSLGGACLVQRLREVRLWLRRCCLLPSLVDLHPIFSPTSGVTTTRLFFGTQVLLRVCWLGQCALL